MKTPSLLSVPLLLGQLLPAASHAATGEATDSTELATVVVTAPSRPGSSYQPSRSVSSGYERAALDTPQAVAVVPPQVIRDQQARTLQEAVNNVSGVVETNTLAGIADSVIRRGFGSRGDGSILRDGVRAATLRNFGVTSDSVEVLKGPASLLYGIQEPGGVINVISKKPQYSQQGSIGLRSSSFGGGAADVDLTGPLGDGGLAYRVIGELEEGDYWRNFGNTRRKLIAPSLAWQDGNSSALLSYEYLDFKTPYDRGTVFANGKPVNIPREQRLDEAWNIAEGTSEALNSSYSRQLNDSWQWKANLGWTRLRYSDNQARPVSYNASTGVLTRSADGNRGFDNTTLLLSTRLQGDVFLFGQRHEPAIVLESEQLREAKGDVLRGNSVGGFNVYDPVYGTLAYPSKLSSSKSDTRSDIDTQALVLQDNWHFADGWMASLGSRYQHYQQEDGSGRPYGVTGRSSGNVLLPQLGLLYRLAPQWSLYGNYSESFKPNTASDGVSFDPERGIVHEVGGKYEHGGISASLALYRIEKSNVLVSENNVSRAVGKVRSQGVELDVSGQLSRQLAVIANYAYTDAEVTEDLAANVGKQLFNVPHHSGGVSLAYDFGRDAQGARWRAGGGLRYVGTRQGDAGNSFELPRYQVADAFVAWQRKVGRNKLDVQLNVKNLFDKTYYSSSSGSALQVKIGDPREISVQTRLSF